MRAVLSSGRGAGGRRRHHCAGASTAALLLAAASLAACSSARPAAAPAVEPPPPAIPHPFGVLSCPPRYGIRLCIGGQVGGRDLRVPSFDGVPLDADVALPAGGRGPFPLIVMLHGLGGSKKDWETKRDDGLVDDVTFARMGYAVLMYTARGFGDSCGTPASRRATPGCDNGFVRLADQRYEVRDTQYLAGLLVDEGLARPDIAVTGVSYGAGQALELAMLKNRVREPDGALVPWTSPRRHVPMAVAAVYAEWPWDDLVTALVPNGHLLTSLETPAVDDLQPAGVEKQSWNNLLYFATTAGFLAPAGSDPSADIRGWFRDISQGEPYSAADGAALAQLQEYHSAIGIPMPAGGPAPAVIQSGWTDTLFPVSEALHYAARVQAAGEHTPLMMIFDDVGHGWAHNKPADVLEQTAQAITFLNDVMLRHASPPSGVLAIGTTCPASAPSAPSLTGASFTSLQAGSLSLGSAPSQTVTSSGGSVTVANALDPAYTSRYCALTSAKREGGTAVYRLSVGRPTTLLGGLVVHAELHVTGDYPELVGRLWDVDPGGKRQLIEAAVFRPDVDQATGSTSRSSGAEAVTFQLDPNLYTVAAGHTLELELVGSTSPWFRASNGTFRIVVDRAERHHRSRPAGLRPMAGASSSAAPPGPPLVSPCGGGTLRAGRDGSPLRAARVAPSRHAARTPLRPHRAAGGSSQRGAHRHHDPRGGGSRLPEVDLRGPAAGYGPRATAPRALVLLACRGA